MTASREPSAAGPAQSRISMIVSFSPTKHTAFGGACGIVMVQFDKSNKPVAWNTYQPSC